MNDAVLLPYDESHLRSMDLREHEASTIGRQKLIDIAAESTCKSIFVGSTPVAILGYYYMWKGVVNVFVIPSKHIRKYSKSFLIAVVTELDALWKDRNLKLHRMETKSRADIATDRWMHWLGFQCEGTMIGYSENRDDYRLWAKVRHGTG